MELSKHEILLNWLKRHDACDEPGEGLPWFVEGGFESASAAWQACENPQWMLWVLKEANLCDAVKDRLFACRCVRDTPLDDGRKVWDLLTDQRSRHAVEVAEKYALGEASEEELSMAEGPAWEAIGKVTRERVGEVERWKAEWAARWAAQAARWTARWAARGEVVGEAAGEAAREAAGWAAGVNWVAREAARGQQACFLREIYGNPFEGWKPE